MFRSLVGWGQLANPNDYPSHTFTRFQLGYRQTGPIRRVDAAGHKMLKRRMWPVADTFDIPVLHTVVMDIIHVLCIIPSVTDGMFPKAPLPNSTLLACQPHRRAPLGDRQCLSESGLDEPPARGNICIALRQGPEAIQMVGQHHPGLDMERVALTHTTHRFTQ
jgi:hypothetical protein